MKTLLNLLNRTANAVKISGGGSSRTTKHLFAIIAFLLIFGVGNVWASNAHHCLIGEPITTWKTTDNWSKSYEEFALTSPANTSWDEFCIYMWVETNQTFAFNNHFFNPGEAKQVGPSSNQATLNNDGGTGKGVATDGTTNAWKYTGATGLVKICAAQSSRDNNQGEWKPYVWVEEAKEIEILKGNKIMFYFGMTTSWNENWNVLRTSNTSEKTADQQYHRLPESKCSSWISVAYVSPAQYYVGKTGWAGVQMESTAEAGCLYSVYNDGSSDKIYKNVAAGAIPHFSTTTVNKTVGTVDSEIAATVTNSIYGNEQVLFYYYTTDGGTTFTKFDPSDISSLAVGVYTVYALGWDGHILVRSDNTVTLNVGVTISLDANGGTDGDVTSVFATSGIAASIGNITAASLPTKTGYTFNGFWTSGGIEVINENGEWKIDVSGYTDNSGNWTCSAASTLYAHWTPEPYTVTLEGMEADGGSVPIQVSVTYDAELRSLETKHTKAHYDLLGYWAASDDHGEYLTDQLIDANGNWIPEVTGYTGNDGAGHPTWVHDFNISLFAQWTEHSYTVTTSVSPAGAGTLSCGSSVTAQWVTPSELITATANPAWKFVRWEYGENVGPATDTGSDNTVRINATVDGTLTAVFEPRFCLVGSIWNDSGNGGMPGYSDYTIDFMVNSTSPINLTCVRKLDPNKTFKFQVHDRKRNMNLGNTPAGGYIGDASLECSIQDRDIPFVTTGHGDYTFTISEIRQDGDAYYPTVSVSGPPSHLVNLSWADVDIDGNWWKTSRSTGGTVAAVATESGDTHPISNGQYVAQGGSITYTATPAPGYRFGGWWNTNWDYKFSDTNPLPHSSISAIENVEGKFEENYTTVTINTNNTRGGTITVGGEAFTWGSTKTAGVTTKRALVVTENTGYTFTHWTLSNTPDFELQDKASADKEVTLAGLGGTNGSSGTLTANFTAKTYNITLDDDQGGEHNGSATISYDATSLSVTNHASIDGWMRLGYWNSAGNKVSDADGKLEANVPDYTNSSKEWNYDDDVTLWAHWYRIVTLDKNGGSDNGTIGVDYKGYSSSLSRPTRNGYSIEGFYAESGCTTKVMNPDGTLVKNVSGYTDSDGKWIHKTADRLYTKWIFVIYRTGDKAEDPRAQNTDVESYEGGTIEKAIEFRMKVQTIDQWYSLSLPFAVSSVKVWDDEDGAYYDIVPYYRTGGKFYTGHYIIRKPETVTNYAIETFEERWVDPENRAVLPEKNIPYIIQWHNPYFLGKYISFFGSTNQAIPSDFNAGEAPSADDVVNVFGNNTMHSGTVMDAYLLDKDYGPSGAWLREEIGTNRTILPFECFIRASQQGTARYRIIRRGMEIDTPTALEQISNHQSPMTIRVYTITGVLIGEYNDCSFQDAAHRIATDYNEGIYILRSENESMKLLLGGK